MQIDFTAKQTWLHRVNPSLKLVLFFVMFLWVLLVHDLDVMIYYTLVPFLLFVFFSGHPWRRLVLFSLPFVLIFISTATTMIFFGKGTTSWFHWGLVHITEESFFRGIHLGFRALNFALLSLTFAITTRPVHLFYSLMQQFRLSPKYAYSFMAALRILPILFEEFQTLQYALKVRGVQDQRGFGSFYRKLKAYSVALLAQSIRRAHRVAVAMEAKRFTSLAGRTYYYKLGFSLADVGVLAYFLVSLLIILALSQYFPMFGIKDVRFYG